jgi:hypothetical protein
MSRGSSGSWAGGELLLWERRLELLLVRRELKGKLHAGK